jgi:hypothetical protein
VDNSDPLDPALNKMIVERIHDDVMEAAKDKIVYDMTSDEIDGDF